MNTWLDIAVRPKFKGWYIVQLIADDGNGRLDDWTSVDYFDGGYWKYKNTSIYRYMDRVFSTREWAETIKATITEFDI